MGERSAIEWTDHTFNPWMGCTKVSPGCDRCYAEQSTPVRVLRARGFETWGPDGTRRRSYTWGDPPRWNKRHAAFFAQHGRRQRVFCASLADVFDNEVPPEWRADLFDLIAATPHLDWLLLTKRIGNAWKMMADALGVSMASLKLPSPNVWLGATVVNQEEADRDIPKLLQVPAAVRFLSIEPMLGPVDLSRWLDRCNHGSRPGPGGAGGVTCAECDGNGDGCHRLHWAICGGETGHGARPMQSTWAQHLRDQCTQAGTPFFFKQWGEWLGPLQDGSRDHTPAHINASDEPMRIGKKAAGRLLDSRTHDDFPSITSGDRS